jgi:hypothetical protein
MRSFDENAAQMDRAIRSQGKKRINTKRQQLTSLGDTSVKRRGLLLRYEILELSRFSKR